MSWSDLFFPGNPGRREEVVRMFTKLLTHMEGNFVTTNDLIDLVHEHLPGRTFKKIKVDHKLTIKDNCETFIARINELKAYIKEKKEKMKTDIDPVVYKEIMDTKVAFVRKLEIGRKIAGASLWSIGTVAGAGICAHIHKGKLLVSMVEKFSKVKILAAASIGMAVATLAIDMIASAIIGAVEKNKLEESIAELEAALKIFEPASRDYSKQITKIQVTIELYAELGLLDPKT